MLQSEDAQLFIMFLKLFGLSAETVASSNEFHGSTTLAVEFCWIPGHAGIAAGDLADAAVKSVAEEAQAWTSEQDESETTMESAPTLCGSYTP